MPEPVEKRGPIEKTKNGWPINPIGVVVLVIFIVVVAYLIAKPLLSRSTSQSNPNLPTVSGQLVSPSAGQIVRGSTLPLELSLDNDSKVAKVEFWAKTYTENKWEIIGEVTKKPFRLDWQIPDNFKNKAIAITAHVFLKDGNIVKDPGGWREGIIILNP